MWTHKKIARARLPPRGPDLAGLPTRALMRPGCADGRPPGDSPGARPAGVVEGAALEHHHRDVQGGGARAAVFGISDGLVTNVSLILGLSGANPPAGVVRLAGLAGLLGGAFSMAAGEYISMRAQSELLERELEFERQELHRRPEGEFRELVKIYESRGISTDLATQVARQMMSDPKTALETHAREELGIRPGLTRQASSSGRGLLCDLQPRGAAAADAVSRSGTGPTLCSYRS